MPASTWFDYYNLLRSLPPLSWSVFNPPSRGILLKPRLYPVSPLLPPSLRASLPLNSLRMERKAALFPVVPVTCLCLPCSNFSCHHSPPFPLPQPPLEAPGPLLPRGLCMCYPHSSRPPCGSIAHSLTLSLFLLLQVLAQLSPPHKASFLTIAPPPILPTSPPCSVMLLLRTI